MASSVVHKKLHWQTNTKETIFFHQTKCNDKILKPCNAPVNHWTGSNRSWTSTTQWIIQVQQTNNNNWIDQMQAWWHSQKLQQELQFFEQFRSMPVLRINSNTEIGVACRHELRSPRHGKQSTFSTDDSIKDTTDTDTFSLVLHALGGAVFAHSYQCLSTLETLCSLPWKIFPPLFTKC